MRALLILLALTGACRKRPPVEAPPPQEVAPREAAPQAVAAPIAAPQQNVEKAPVFGHAPTDDELRAALKPLLPAVGKCVVKQNPEGPVVLSFSLSPATGTALAVRLAGRGDDCSAEALHGLRFEPWSAGAPSMVALPLTQDGQPMTESDGGLR